MIAVSRSGLDTFAERRSTGQKELDPRLLLEFDHQIWGFHRSGSILL